MTLRAILLSSAVLLGTMGLIAAPVFAAEAPMQTTAMSGDAPVANEPIAAAEAALVRARGALQCRFAFSLQEEAANRAVWVDRPLTVRQSLEFDPRRDPGERWRVLNTTRTDTRAQRRQLNLGGRSDPRTDLLSLTVEGDVRITNLQLKETRPDAWVFSFVPEATNEVSTQGQSFLNELVGELVVSRQTGSVIERTLLVDGAYDAGQGRVQNSRFTRRYRDVDGLTVVATTEQQFMMSARGQPVRTTGRQTYSGVTPICAAGDLEAINLAEATSGSRERDDTPAPARGARPAG